LPATMGWSLAMSNITASIAFHKEKGVGYFDCSAANRSFWNFYFRRRRVQKIDTSKKKPKGDGC